MTTNTNIRGIGFLLAGAGVFILNDSMMKLVMADLPQFEVLFLRGISGCLWALPLLFFMGDMRALPLAKNRWVLARGILESLAVCTFFIALAHTEIGTLVAVFQTTPLLIVAGTVFLHHEPLGRMRLFLIAAGFAGALLVAQPGAEGSSPYALLGFLTAIGAAGRDLVGRRIPHDTPALVTIFATMVMVSVAGAIVGVIFEIWTWPNLWAFGMIFGAGLLMMLGHVFTILAFRHSDAQIVAPFYYAFMIWAVVLGFLIFGDRPNALALAGMAIIVISGLTVIWLEWRSSGKKPDIMPIANSDTL